MTFSLVTILLFTRANSPTALLNAGPLSSGVHYGNYSNIQFQLHKLTSNALHYGSNISMQPYQAFL
jgi:hypothetical protein